MQNDEFKVTREERIFFDTLKFSIFTDNIIEYMRSSLKEFLEMYDICEDRVTDISFKNISKVNEETKFLVEIKFCKVDRAELNSMEIEERIRTVLKQMGYSDNNIRNITYRKYWSNSDEKVWVARVYDKQYNDYDPDELYAAREHESGIVNAIKEILGFLVIIDFD